MQNQLEIIPATAGRMPSPRRARDVVWRCAALLLGLGFHSQVLGQDAVPAAGAKPLPRESQAAATVTNRLARETSPYLLLHAQNPVDWFPWGAEALEKARRENKPIFLSIGYCSCFWCHVMEREVFSHAEIAAYMNEYFVNIKVDREERPDLDEIYMLSLQVYLQLAGSSQGGGWPLSIFLTPEGKPIAGGTYFPPNDQPGRPGFLTVCRQIQKAWLAREQDVRATADLVSREVARLSHPAEPKSPVKLSTELVQASVAATVQSYDREYGGFGFDADKPDSPKFPSPSRLQLLQAQIGQSAAGDDELAQQIDATLVHMAAGGIRDHLAGGFHRYSTDRQWHVPHFEKMLYDNAQLADVYLDAYRRTGRENYRQIVEETIRFVRGEMASPGGGFIAAIDAETQGIEGEYYVWTRPQLEKILSGGNLRLFSTVYGFDEPQIFHAGYVLHLSRPLDQSAEKLGLPLAELQARLSQIRAQLLEVRRQRPSPLKDDQVLTAWNGLMIRALARAGQILKRREYVEAAEQAAHWMLSQHRNQEGRLLRSSRNGQPGQPAFLDDYAFLVSGFLSLHEATGEDKWLSAARRLMDDQLALFWDQDHGGFFFTASDQEAVLARLKNAYDGVLPSGNSVSARNLVRLARIKSEETYRTYAQKTLEAFSPQLQASPESMPHFALALQEYQHWYGRTDNPSAGEGLFTGSLSRPEAPRMPAAEVQPKETEPVARLIPQAAESGKHPQVTARAFLSTDRLPAGGKSRLAVEIVIADGWHLNANPPRPDYLIPTRITLTTPAGLELSQISYPSGHEFSVKGIEEPLIVYEGTIYITADVSIPESLSGSAELGVRLQYQACNDQNCLQPRQLNLTGTIPIAPAGEAVRAANADVFNQLWPSTQSKPSPAP